MKQQYTFRIEENLLQQVKTIARNDTRTASSIINIAINEYVIRNNHKLSTFWIISTNIVLCRVSASSVVLYRYFPFVNITLRTIYINDL